MPLDFTPLLTAHLFASEATDQEELQKLAERLEEGHITVKLHDPGEPLTGGEWLQPRVYISLGEDWREFKPLVSLPFHEKKRWLHYNAAEEISPASLFFCWLKATDPLPEPKKIPETRFSSDMPLVSVFTASYRSKEKIQRPYRSLLKQTYPNWEWVIVDDSDDGEETYKQFLLPLEDHRVRRYRQDRRNGYIGAIKRYAAGLCKGEILVEVDHDDDLTPDCLEKIVSAFKDNPDCGFVYGDCAEVYAGSNHAHWYGWDCGYGYSVFYRVFVHEMNRWQNVQRTSTINWSTIRHLVGLPNHPRAWTRDCYHLVGGHRDELLVSDDYDILVRTFLCTTFVCIPDLVYIQYRNEHGNNTTFLRNKQIQVLVAALYRAYYERIITRLRELDLPEAFPYRRLWLRPADDPGRKTANRIKEDASRVSLLFPIPHSSDSKTHAQLLKSMSKELEEHFRDTEIVVVGRIPEEVEIYASKARMGAIRWWPMEAADDLETCIQYAKLVASCKEKVVILP